MDAVSGQSATQDNRLRHELISVQREVRALAARDREVRAHEQAHAAVGGKYAGSPQYDYTRGPNGVSYATSGHVSIDVSPVPNDPQATLEKMQTVARAALAPAEPSSQDRAVAAKANREAAQARAEIARKQGEGSAAILTSTEGPSEVGSTAGSLIDLIV